MDTSWKSWTLATLATTAATLFATGNGQIIIEIIASTGIATADGLTWLIAQGAAQ